MDEFTARAFPRRFRLATEQARMPTARACGAAGVG
ncbi:hypothetical protein P873_08750 [Arenimonas composti TR7-09 = DSM 18010]|uniref:Uncharacterized protein n=1 Tax=Arenimonas composti TR7-09 = DSM 18010 TaxID=1121013 RepID=A0A091BEH7_9GAMM|nr:hypothetical protein P873_08750 [Arenimonas composti TR7-09 = DSM 18010]